MSKSSESASSQDMSREDFTELFVDILYICEPEHPFYDEHNPYKEISKDDIVTSYCRSDSKYHAKCGPRRTPLIAKYSIDIGYFQSRRFSECLAITVHEATHISVGRHNDLYSSSHPPEFWEKMGMNAQDVLDNWGYLENKWGNIDPEVFRKRLIIDPNSQMVDRRSQTPEEASRVIKNLIADQTAKRGD